MLQEDSDEEESDDEELILPKGELDSEEIESRPVQDLAGPKEIVDESTFGCFVCLPARKVEPEMNAFLGNPDDFPRLGAIERSPAPVGGKKKKRKGKRNRDRKKLNWETMKFEEIPKKTSEVVQSSRSVQDPTEPVCTEEAPVPKWYDGDTELNP